MISKEKVIAGAGAYVDREVLPRLPELKSLMVAGVVSLYLRRAPELFARLENDPAVKMAGVMADGMIDVDALYDAFAPKISKPVELSVPLIGCLSFDRTEVDKLLHYIREA